MAGPPRLLVKVTQPVAMALSGHRWLPLWAVMHHVGRRSGREYAVPIAVVPTDRRDVVLIALPWGERTNWARNVLAAGGARLSWRGQEVPVTNPRIVDTPVAVGLVRRPLRRMIGSGRLPAFLLLDR